jgi:WD40 repeat protein
MISEQQRQYAVRQQTIAQEQRSEAVAQRRQADQSRQEAIQSRDEAQSQRREALAQKQIADQERLKAEESERTARRLRLLTTSRSLAVQAQQLSSSAEDDLPALLALTAFDMNRENGGFENDAAIYGALSAIAEDPVKLRAHTDAVRDAVVSGDGAWLYSCGDDGKVLQWNLADLQEAPLPATLPGNIREAFRSLALTQDGSWLLAGTSGGKIIAWKRANILIPPLVIQAHSRIVNDLAADPGGHTFYSCGSDGKLMVWRPDGETFKGSVLDSVAGNVRCLQPGPSGKQIFYGADDGMVRTLLPHDDKPNPQILMNLQSPVLSLALSSEGNTLAAGVQNGTIYTLSPVSVSGNTAALQGRHISGVTGLAFNPKVQTLVSSGYDRTVKVSFYPIKDDRQMSLENHGLWVYGICYTVDAEKLISYSADKTLTMVSARSSDIAERVRKIVNRNLTPEEWKRFLGDDIPYRKIFDNLP